MRKNSWHTDLKWNSKKRLKSLKNKTQQLADNWHGEDFCVVAMLEDIIAKIEDIEKEIDSIDVRKF